MKPFRWSIAKREQLGTLIEQAGTVDPRADGVLREVRRASARIIAFADDANLAFIGRTPENFFDYLSGVFEGIDDAPSLHLLQFSLRWAGPNGLSSIDPEKLDGFFAYLKEECVDAATISSADKPLALVDFIAYGGTMENFVSLLHMQAKRDGIDWNAVQRRLRIIGLRVQTHNSPNTWRWQQHQTWLDMIPDTKIKNVSAPASLLFHLANDQPKVTYSFHPGRWGQDEELRRTITEDQIKALALAAGLYDAGKDRNERTRLAGLITSTPEMRQPATRRLASRIKG